MGNVEGKPTPIREMPGVGEFAENSEFDGAQEYEDTLERINEFLPRYIDEESRTQVEDYMQACNKGKGPMVACFSTAEYLSAWLNKHLAAAHLYEITCFRPKDDKSPNGVLVDGTKAYPASCFNLAKMKLTGKGGLKVDNDKAYKLMERACRGGHGGACYWQATLLSQPKGSMEDIPHDMDKAMELYQQSCDRGDSLSCYTLATMLLRGQISARADNVSPLEAEGVVPPEKRENEIDRTIKDDETPVPRNAPRARDLLHFACDKGGHVTSCYNLAVMYTMGDEGVPVNEELAGKYQRLTEEKIEEQGGMF